MILGSSVGGRAVDLHSTEDDSAKETRKVWPLYFVPVSSVVSLDVVSCLSDVYVAYIFAFGIFLSFVRNSIFLFYCFVKIFCLSQKLLHASCIFTPH